MKDEELMRRTFTLAKKALGFTWPNPMVGAVLVKNGNIIGEGYHQRYGGDHAEVMAFNNATESPQGATLYVNLEPCCHTKKQTPPCAQRIIKEKVKKVIIGSLDPNPQVNGKGVELLTSAGIEVDHCLSAEADELNEVFFMAQKKQRSFVHLKLAATLDGKIALPSGESQWISSSESRRYVHELRAQAQAIGIGAQTLRIDDPTLNVRLEDFKREQPKRVVFTRSGVLPEMAKLFSDEQKENTLIYTQKKLSFPFPNEQVIHVSSLQGALSDLYDKKIIAFFLEGGAELASAFIKEELVDKVSLFLNPSFLGEGTSVLKGLGLEKLANRPRLTNLNSTWIGGDLYLTGKIQKG